MKYELKFPITGTDGKLIKTIEIGTVKVKHLKAAEGARQDGGDMAVGIALLAAVTQLPVETIEEMSASDFSEMSEKMTDFLPKPA
jgi:hypothetical protein